MQRLTLVLALIVMCTACSGKSFDTQPINADGANAGQESEAVTAGTEASAPAQSEAQLAANPGVDLPADAELLEPELTQAPEDLEEAGETAEIEAPEPPTVISGIEIPPEAYENKAYQRYFNLFTGVSADGKPLKGRRAFQRWLDRSGPLMPYVRKVLAERNMPAELAYLPFAESGYNAWAYSRAGAAGVWQFMPFTGRKFGLTVDWWMDERRDPYKATHAAADYLEVLHGMFDDWLLALAAYNCGEGRVDRALRKTGCDTFFELAKKKRSRRRGYLSRETRNYVPKFLAIVTIMRNLEELGFNPPQPAEEPVTLMVKGGTDLAALAKHAGLSWKEFNRLNPSYRRTVSHPEKECTVYLEKGHLASAQEFLDTPGARPYAGWKQYRVRSGDSLWRISRRQGVPISIIKQVNNLHRNMLQPGQRLLIPGSAVAAARGIPASAQRSVRSASQHGAPHHGRRLPRAPRRHPV